MVSWKSCCHSPHQHQGITGRADISKAQPTPLLYSPPPSITIVPHCFVLIHRQAISVFQWMNPALDIDNDSDRKNNLRVAIMLINQNGRNPSEVDWEIFDMGLLRAWRSLSTFHLSIGLIVSRHPCHLPHLKYWLHQSNTKLAISNIAIFLWALVGSGYKSWIYLSSSFVFQSLNLKIAALVSAGQI